jgi:hypothetical protein
VLVVAGSTGAGDLASALVYDPVADAWAATGSLSAARDSPTCAVLQDGKVLLSGGIAGLEPHYQAAADAELFDPATAAWSPAGTPLAARALHTLTVLPTGEVLAAAGIGGSSDAWVWLASAELYHPGSNSWTGTGALTVARGAHTATLLPTGDVLVAGGIEAATLVPLASSELYDPAAETWTAAGPLINASMFHTATLLNTGGALAVGGSDSEWATSVASAAVYDAVDCTTATVGTTCGLCLACATDGTCASVTDGTPCELWDQCTIGTVCVAGVCDRGSRRVCHDYCRQYQCTPGVGCPFEHPCEGGLDGGWRDAHGGRPDGPYADHQDGSAGGPNCTCAGVPTRRAPPWLALAPLAAWASRRRATSRY